MKNKRGMLFTITAIVLILLFIATFTLNNIKSNRKAIDRRIITMNDFMYQTDQDFKRQIYITGYRIVFLTEKKIVEKGDFISNFSEISQEAFYNGTIEGTTQELMLGVRYQDLESILQERAAKINANITFSNPTFSMVQEDPWTVTATLSLNLTVSDLTNLASWERYQIVKTEVPIVYFEDPLYFIGTQGKIVQKIAKSNYLPFVSGTDVSNLSTHLTLGLYTNSTLSPSFIDRLEGKTSPNPWGIESLVNLQRLAAEGIIAQEKSVVDFIYFSSNNPSSAKVTGMPSWFYLDSDHYDFYGVTGLTY